MGLVFSVISSYVPGIDDTLFPSIGMYNSWSVISKIVVVLETFWYRSLKRRLFMYLLLLAAALSSSKPCTSRRMISEQGWIT